MTTMTVEDELNLIKGVQPKDPLQSLSDTYQAAIAPAAPAAVEPGAAPDVAPTAPKKTRAEIDAELGLPPSETGLASTPDVAGTWDVLSAAWQSETIKTDAWNDAVARKNALLTEMYALLAPEGKRQVFPKRASASLVNSAENILAAARAEAAASREGAERWAGFPQTKEAFDGAVNAGRTADLEEAASVLDQPGGGFAEFFGTAARGITDETSLMLLPFGLSGNAWRMIAGEIVLGGVGEAAILPKEARVAEELGLAAPDPISRIGMGMATGGLFAGALAGLGKGYSALKARAEARRASLGETAPPGVDRMDHEADIEGAEAYMRGDQTVQERLGGLKGGARAEAPPDGTLGAIVGTVRPARVVMANTAATRSQPVDPVLETRMGEAVGAVYGPGFEVRVYSGGQPSADQGGARKGSVRHDHGKAADIHIYGPDGQQITGDALAPLAQYWAARGYGGIGMEMEGGGVHLDMWEIPPAGGGMAWNYAADGGSITPAQQAAIDAGLRGEMPALQGGAAPPRAAGAPPILPPITADAPPDWSRIRNGIFAGESGADFNALFGFSNRKGGKWSNIKPTEMTVDQWLEFQDPSGPYGQWVKANRPDPENGVATPMGAYQIVGSTLRDLKRDLGLKGDEVMSAEFQDYLGQQIYLKQGTGAWQGYKGPRDAYTPGSVDGPAPDMGPSSRGYTGSGQVAAGDDMRIDVDYEVVDYTSLIRASGDLQPRDRSRINSDEWIASTAARLDPAQLMPSPNAATGTPIVGPDNIIESGNGRAAVIGRAYEQVPDRAQAYRGAIEAAGYTIPAGVDRPVLIARRRTPLDDTARKRLVIEAQDSGVAQMTPTEVARATARNLQAPILSRLDPSAPLASDANGGFVRAALATLPRSARNAMFDPSGALNANGQRQLREALFARAWPDPDILARYTEGAPAELKSLMEALETAAPSWAALRADIEAGLVTPEMDIGGHVLDAMRLIAAARELSAREGKAIAKAVQELLEDVDMLEGAVAPLTAALVRKMWRGGRAAPADDVAAFLTRYADEARKAGASGSMFDTPTPRDVLRTIDAEGFKDLPDDLGQARGFATRDSEAPAEAVRDLPDQGFDQGAQSPDAEAVHGEIVAAIRTAVQPKKPARAMPDASDELAEFLQRSDGITTMAEFLSKADKKWLRDAYQAGLLERQLSGLGSHYRYRYPVDGSNARWQRETDPSAAPAGREMASATLQATPASIAPDMAPAAPALEPALQPIDLPALAQDQATRDLARARDDLGDFADMEIDLPDGTTARAGDILDDLDADRAADEAINTCLLSPTEAFTKGATA